MRGTDGGTGDQPVRSAFDSVVDVWAAKGIRLESRVWLALLHKEYLNHRLRALLQFLTVLGGNSAQNKSS